MKQKLRIIFLPFLLATLLTFVGYNLLRWWLDIYWGILPLTAEIWGFWLPMALPWIPILWMNTRINTLKGFLRFDSFWIMLLMWGAMGAPLIFSQTYLTQAGYPLNHVADIAGIGDHSQQKYYQIKSFSILEDEPLSHVDSRVTGSKGTTLQFNQYFLLPFEGSANRIWYATKYIDDISNSASRAEKDAAYRSFQVQNRAKFGGQDFQKVNYFEKVGNSRDGNGYLRAIAGRYPQIAENSMLILEARQETFSERYAGSWKGIWLSLGIGILVVLINILLSKVDEREMSRFIAGEPSSAVPIAIIILAVFVPIGNRRTTASMQLLSLAGFIWLATQGVDLAFPTAQELLEVGGLRRAEVMDGQVWRLLSSVFLHAGIYHLAINMVWLALAGALVEVVVGPWRMLLIFLLSGLAGGLASIWWHLDTVSVGASGAITGLLGLILVLNYYRKFGDGNYRKLIAGLVLGSLAATLVMSLWENIDNAAHLGGLLVGVLAGFILRRLPAAREEGD